MPLIIQRNILEIAQKHELEDKTYQEEFEKRAWYPDVYIYIDTPAKTCFRNIQSRHQAGDQGVSLEYLQTLEVRYKEMFEGLTMCHRFRVDGNRDVDEVHKDILKIIYKYQ